jgi:hypothetical protein
VIYLHLVRLLNQQITKSTNHQIPNIAAAPGARDRPNVGVNSPQIRASPSDLEPAGAAASQKYLLAALAVRRSPGPIPLRSGLTEQYIGKIPQTLSAVDVVLERFDPLVLLLHPSG